MRASLCLCLAGLLLAAPAAAETHCEDSFKEQLSRLGIAEEDIESITIVKETTASGGAASSWATGYDAWVKLKSCPKGSLVLHSSMGCKVQEAYTTGACRVPGL